MLKKYFISTVLFMVLFSSGVYAAEKNVTQPPKQQKSEVSKKKEDNSDAIVAAKKLLEEMGLKKVYENAVENSTNRLLKANPAFEKIKDKIKAFYEKNIGWDVMKEDLAKLYAKYFTKKELEDITAFYKTQTGKKVLSKMGQLTYEGQMLTRKRLEPHLGELKKLLDDAIAKEQQKKEKQTKK